MTSVPVKGKIGKGAVVATAPYISTRSSGDRAFGSGPKGRRFNSCRVQRRNLDFSRFLFLCVAFRVALLIKSSFQMLIDDLGYFFVLLICSMLVNHFKH